MIFIKYGGKQYRLRFEVETFIFAFAMCCILAKFVFIPSGYFVVAVLMALALGRVLERRTKRILRNEAAVREVTER